MKSSINRSFNNPQLLLNSLHAMRRDLGSLWSGMLYVVLAPLSVSLHASVLQSDFYNGGHGSPIKCILGLLYTCILAQIIIMCQNFASQYSGYKYPHPFIDYDIMHHHSIFKCPVYSGSYSNFRPVFWPPSSEHYSCITGLICVCLSSVSFVMSAQHDKCHQAVHLRSPR
jgi:hypothetical protein